jgi:hypothetical protein
MAFKQFQNGFPLPASDLNNFLMRQSVITFANATARTAAISSPNEGMLTYLEDTNAYEYWDGTAFVALVEEPDLTALIPKSTVTTSQDLIVADGASSVTRLGVGTDEQVLSVVAGEVAWADAAGGGGMTLISTTTLSGATVTLSSIPQTYTDLAIMVKSPSATTSFPKLIYKINNSETMHTYNTGDRGFTLTNVLFAGVPPSGSTDFHTHFFQIPNYSESGYGKISLENTWEPGVFSSNSVSGTGGTKDTDAVTSLVFGVNSGVFDGGTIKLWGIK